jgi:hypothetical protein
MDQDRRPDHRPHLPLLLAHLRTGTLGERGQGGVPADGVPGPGLAVVPAEHVFPVLNVSSTGRRRPAMAIKYVIVAGLPCGA